MAMDASGDYPRTHAQKCVKQFIQLYRASPELWDPMNEDYANQGKRMIAQQRLLEVMKKMQPDATRHDVRAKINSLRSNYKKLYVKVQAAKAEGREYAPKNWMFKYLRFLDKVIRKDRLKSEPDSEGGYTDSEDYSKDASFKMSPVYVVMDEASTHEGYEDVKFQPSPVKKLKVERVESSTPTKRILRFDGIKEAQLASTGIEPIALVWSSKLQALKATQRLLAEKAINDVLFEASLNNLGKGALVINSGSSVSTEALKEEYLECPSSDEELH